MGRRPKQPQPKLTLSLESRYALRIEEAAQYLGCSVKSIRKAYKDGRLPYRRSGDHYTFRIVDLEAFHNTGVVGNAA